MYLRLLSSSSTFLYRILETKDFLDDAEQEDPTMFVSEKTHRGPLDENWLEEYSAACLVFTINPTIWIISIVFLNKRRIDPIYR